MFEGAGKTMASVVLNKQKVQAFFRKNLHLFPLSKKICHCLWHSYPNKGFLLLLSWHHVPLVLPLNFFLSPAIFKRKWKENPKFDWHSNMLNLIFYVEIQRENVKWVFKQQIVEKSYYLITTVCWVPHIQCTSAESFINICWSEYVYCIVLIQMWNVESCEPRSNNACSEYFSCFQFYFCIKKCNCTVDMYFF